MLTIRQSALEIKNLASIDKINFLPLANVITNLALLALKTISCTRFGKNLNNTFEILQSKSFKDLFISALPIIGNVYSFYKVIAAGDTPKKAATIDLAPQHPPLAEEPPEPAPQVALPDPFEILHTPIDEAEGFELQDEKKQQAKEKIQAFIVEHLRQIESLKERKKTQDQCSKVAFTLFSAGALALISLQALNYFYLKQNA